MFRILIDADLILEAVMNRSELTADVTKLLEMVDSSIQMYLTNVGLQKIYAYTACLKNRQMANIVVDWLEENIKICIVDQSMMHTARLSPLKNFESAVEVVCLNHYQLNAIITNQPEDFRDVVNRFHIWSFRDLWLRVNLETQLQVSF
ncbi:hypothetical protein H6G36_22055 [Anabaena minutissima FACHB-250]|nr:hypothetical protein [Anabaena minutissima FACHB-250]